MRVSRLVLLNAFLNEVLSIYDAFIRNNPMTSGRSSKFMFLKIIGLLYLTLLDRW